MRASGRGGLINGHHTQARVDSREMGVGWGAVGVGDDALVPWHLCSYVSEALEVGAAPEA